MKTTLDPIFFKHEYNARGDEKILRLIRVHGWAGYGLYWALVEKLYEAGGRLRADYDHLAFDLRVDTSSIKAIITQSDLFHLTKDGAVFGSRAVDRQLENVRTLSSKRSRAGTAGAAKRWLVTDGTLAKQLHGNCMATTWQRREEKRREEGGAQNAPSNDQNNTATDSKVKRCARCFTAPLEAGQAKVCKKCSWCSQCNRVNGEPSLDPNDPQQMLYLCHDCTTTPTTDATTRTDPQTDPKPESVDRTHKDSE